MKTVNYSVTGDQVAIRTKNYFECRNKCINDTECAFSIRTYLFDIDTKTNNCYLVYNIKSNVSKVDTDTEYALLQGNRKIV